MPSFIYICHLLWLENFYTQSENACMNEPGKLRVLHVTGLLNCGGAENMLMAIFRKLDRSRISFSFLVHTNVVEPGYFDREVHELGGRIYYIKSQGRLGPWLYIMALKKFLCENGPYDIVHSHLDWQGGLIALAARLTKVPRVIIHAHTSMLLSNRLSVRLFLPVQKWLIRHYASECWACSREASDFVFGKKMNTRIVPNAIDLSRFFSVQKETRAALREQWGCDERTLVLVHAGSFGQVKNQEFLIEIAICLEEQGIDYRLILAGKNDNDYGQKIRDKVRNAGLSGRVIFLGIRDDLHLVFSGCDRFLFPSLFEGLGIVCVEAQAAGLYCILSPGIPREVDMGLNLIKRVESMIPEKWAEEILGHVNDPTPAKQTIVNNMRERGYDIEQNISEIEQCYLSS